jgi:Tfp pilus assembly protein PilF
LLDRFEPALDVLRRALANDPRNAQLHRIEALCLEALGRTSAAEDAFRQAIGLPNRGSPDDDPAIDYGVFLYRQGRGDEALGPLRRAKGARAELELGCVLLSLDRLKEASAHLERAVTLDPNSSRARLLLDKAKARLGNRK